MGEKPQVGGGPIEPSRPGGSVSAPVNPWGPLLLVCALVVAAAAGLLAVHAANRWRSFAALPQNAPAIGVEATVLSDIVPTLADVAVLTSWVGFVVSFIWDRARRRGRLGPRFPVPGDISFYIAGTWVFYLVTHYAAITMSRSAVLTNATIGAAWACSAISWTALCVSWAVAAFTVPGYDRIPVPGR